MATETPTTNTPDGVPASVKDLFTENPRWCVGCGDFSIIMAVKRFMVEEHIVAHNTVNVSGIGCSGRAPNYIDTYGIHGIHGRAIPLTLGLALARPDLNLFVHSGDGDAISIGGCHLIHGINKNFNCVFILYDNEIYALTKNQTSPTTRKEHKTQTQPYGTYLEPINALQLVLGAGASFVAHTADWMPDHLVSTLKAAYEHKGFSFVHVYQRCPHFDPDNWDHKSTSWFSFLTHDKGIPPDKRLAEKVPLVPHDPTDKVKAFQMAEQTGTYFGLYYINPNKPCYDQLLHDQVKNTPQKQKSVMLDEFKI